MNRNQQPKVHCDLNDPKGREMLKEHLGLLHSIGRCAAATVRIPAIRDKIPHQVREDILRQSYQMIGHIHTTMTILELSDDKEFEPVRLIMIASVMAAVEVIYQQEGGLKKLCESTLDVWSPNWRMIPARRYDIDY